MPATASTTIEVSRHGAVDPNLSERLVDKVRRVAEHCREPVHHIEARLTLENNPRRSRPAMAECSLDIDGRTVRAHVAAETVAEAVDLLVDKLDRRLRRHEDRRHRTGDRHRRTQPDDGEWRHGDLPTERPEWVVLDPDEREVRRQKAFLLAPMRVEEARWDLEQLGHDFYLFVEETSGLDAVLGHDRDGGLELRAAVPDAIDATEVPEGIALIPTPPPVLDLAEAREFLDAAGSRWLFHRPGPMARAQVLYRRYDGHDGLITAQADDR